MIDRSKLEALSIESLIKLKAIIDETMAKRKRSLLRPGRMATFVNSRNGDTVRIMIDKVGPKNIAGYVVAPDGAHMLKSRWRVNPEFLTPWVEPPKPVVKPLGVGADRPAAAPQW